jgi:putative spermidine/putrescine transport system substrate-binding protein
LDVERAFASLERIYPHVISWYEDGQQPVQLVLSGTAGLASAWNIRVFMSTIEGQVAFQWNQAMLSANSWVVLSGAQNVDVAMDFINYATRAVPNANFCRLLPFGPVNRDALALIRPDRLAMLPTAEPQRHLQFVENWNYWNDHREALTARYLAWLEAERAQPGPGTPEMGS